MRPALQRLLLWPSSLKLLRYLFGNPRPFVHAPAVSVRQCHCNGVNRTESPADSPVGPQDAEVSESKLSPDVNISSTHAPILFCPSTRSRRSLPTGARRNRNYSGVAAASLNVDHGVSGRVPRNVELGAQEYPGMMSTCSPDQSIRSLPTETLLGKPALAKSYYGPWKKPPLWTSDEIDFESNLAAPVDPARQRLMDQPEHKQDLQLFARLLDHRERRFGLEGLRTFWEAVKKRGVHLPTRDYREPKNKGLPAEKLWTSFLKLGFYDNQVLEEVCAYADELLELKQRRWPRLYATIVQHFLVRGQGGEALAWHHRLFERHPPSAFAFAELCHRTVHHRGDLNALKEIYDKNDHRNAYGKIVPTLCRQEDFRLAKEWHFRLIAKGDIPLKPQHAQILSRFLAIYDRDNALRVTKSLVAAGAPFQISNTMTNNVKISREMMNLVHGETFQIPVKAYNDEYGARWFATTWVSLDLTMQSVRALGIPEIGPLSLQALCLRNEPDGIEPQPQTILRRIEQLQSYGLATGSSLFSRAVKHFAQNRMFKYLMGTLKSDQHPLSLEDWKFLETLLAYFARIRDWEQYKRILAIRTLGTKWPATEAQNIWLRAQITNNDLAAALNTLERMLVDGTIVKATTIAYILKTMLEPRRRGRKLETASRNLVIITTILKRIIDAGNWVPAAYWREVIRRFGMMRPNGELRELCIFLASRYGPLTKSSFTDVGTRPTKLHQVPLGVNPSHPLHPLKILFPVTLQKSIVAWGFIHAIRQAGNIEPALQQGKTKRLNLESGINCQVTAGIILLRDLQGLGVHIDQKAIKKAIFDRLVIYYSAGRSTKLYNRRARQYVPDLEVTKRLIDKAMGRNIFGRDLKDRILLRGRMRLIGKARKSRTQNTKRVTCRIIADDGPLL